MEITRRCAATAAVITTGFMLGVFLLPPGSGAARIQYPIGNNMPMTRTVCSCPTYHPQNHICQIADVVFRAVIMWKEPTESKNKSALSGSTLTYSMLTDKVYKRHNKVRKGREVLVKTSASNAMCGVTGLNVNEEYLITGNVIGNELIISTCNFIRPWSHVTSMQKSAFKDDYKDSCDMCYVTQQHDYRHIRSINEPTDESTYYAEPDNSTLMCPHSPRQSALLEMEDCETEYSTCVLHRLGSCKWHMNRKYSKCLAKRGRKTKLMMAKYGPSMFGPQPIKLKGGAANKGSKSLKKQKSKRGKKKLHNY